MKYVYPAIISRAKDPEELWYINFPDVEGAFTDAKSLYEAILMAEDVLASILVTYEDFKAGKLNNPMNNRIVEPTPIEQIKAEPDEFSTSAFVTLLTPTLIGKCLPKWKKPKLKKFLRQKARHEKIFA